jgi:LPXTG-site transpeptidase (sortase) family protein
MAPIASKRRLILIFFLGVLPVFALRCSPAGGPSPVHLPTPRAGITPGLQPTTIPRAASTGTPAPASANESDMAQLADQLFGEKLIERITIPVLHLDSRVVPVGWHVNPEAVSDEDKIEWDSPYEAVGWMISSALPGQAGNTVLYGHNNMYTSIFKDLGRLAPGDAVYLYTGHGTWEYQVSQVEILPVLSAGVDQQANYLSYLESTAAPRLTLISCWPPISNTHRVIAIADLHNSP